MVLISERNRTFHVLVIVSTSWSADDWIYKRSTLSLQLMLFRLKGDIVRRRLQRLNKNTTLSSVMSLLSGPKLQRVYADYIIELICVKGSEHIQLEIEWARITILSTRACIRYVMTWIPKSIFLHIRREVYMNSSNPLIAKLTCLELQKSYHHNIPFADYPMTKKLQNYNWKKDVTSFF